MLLTCQPGFEDLLEAEVTARGGQVLAAARGWVRAELPEGHDLAAYCFLHTALAVNDEVTGESVNALAKNISEKFGQQLTGKRIEGPWPLVFTAAAGLDGLGRRMDGVARAFRDQLKQRMSRLAKLSTDDLPRVGWAEGYFPFFVDFHRVLLASRMWCNGQARMADDRDAPSRSYLKVEEAYGVLGREPQEGETVVDLGAAPGGWSFSAAKRGASVIAIDNGPLKAGAADNGLIEHRREDAFGFAPPDGVVYDWMFCDLVEDPHHVMRNLIAPWLERGWCRHFVVIFKFGRTDPLALLHEIQDAASIFSRNAPGFRVRHLFHDREEFTVVGSLGEVEGVE